MKSYYPTIPISAPELLAAERSNQKQETRILHWMTDHPGAYSAWDLSQFFTQIPITSIRRALFNLQEQALIREVGITIGKYGEPVTKFTAQSIHQFTLF